MTSMPDTQGQRVAASAPTRAELRALTGIRGIAAWLVVFYHARLLLTDLLPGWMIDGLAKGYLAVDFFFMLSGFVIGYNYSGKFAEQGLRAAGPFLWRRFARIWPLHIVILAAMVAFVGVLVATGRDYSGYPLHELPLHILLMQNWGFTHALSWNHPAWSISTEAAAYLMFPLFVLIVQPARRATAVLLTCLAVLLTGLYAAFHLAGHSGLGSAIPQMGLIRCLIQFAVGVILCILWQRWAGGPRKGIVALVLAGVLLIAGVWSGIAETAFVPLVMATGLMGLALDRGVFAGFFSGKVVHWLGEISYSTYLSHFFLLILYKIAFVDASLQMGAVQLAGYTLLVLGASVVLYYGVERPGQRWIAAFGSKRAPVDRASVS